LLPTTALLDGEDVHWRMSGAFARGSGCDLAERGRDLAVEVGCGASGTKRDRTHVPGAGVETARGLPLRGVSADETGSG